MALLKRLYRTKATKTHRAYQKYVRQEIVAKRKPMTFRRWSESKGLTVRTKAVKRGLKRAGVSGISAARKAREAARAASRKGR
jgi:hypothetical protein